VNQDRSGRRPNMKEIARAVGVHQSTVSRVVNGSPGRVPVGQETQERILRAVKELGYRPNPLARGLRGASTALLGLIVREVADPFFASAIEIIAREARRHDYNLVLGHARSSGDEALALSGILETRHCDAIVLLGDVRHIPAVWADLSRSTVPLVALCQGSRTPGIQTINTDNRRGSKIALDYLHTLGHRRIAFVDGGWLGDVAERRSAYLEWMSHQEMPVPTGYLQPGDNHPEFGMTAFGRLMALPQPPTAIVCATDQLAFGVLAAAARAGSKVPDDVSVVGFDDIPMARIAVPSLTTVKQPLEELARLGIEAVLAMLRGDEVQPAQMQLCEPELIVRASCGAPSSRS